MERREVVEKLKSFDWEQRGVEFAVLFGSTARGLAGPLSDVDIAVKGDVDVVELVLDISSLLDLPEDRVDVVVVNEEMPYSLLRAIAVEGIPVYVKDREAWRDFVVKALSLYLDFRVFVSKYEIEWVRRFVENSRSSKSD